LLIIYKVPVKLFWWPIKIISDPAKFQIA